MYSYIPHIHNLFIWWAQQQFTCYSQIDFIYRNVDIFLRRVVPKNEAQLCKVYKLHFDRCPFLFLAKNKIIEAI